MCEDPLPATPLRVRAVLTATNSLVLQALDHRYPEALQVGQEQLGLVGDRLPRTGRVGFAAPGVHD